MPTETLRQFLGELRDSGDATAAAAVVGWVGGIEAEAGVGAKRRDGSGRVTTSSLFDLASLTKPATATLALALDASGELPLTATVAGTLGRTGSVVSGELARRRLATLLRHRSGFRPWTPLFVRCRAPAEATGLLSSAAGLLGAPAGTYSDLGYVLYGRIAERCSGRTVEALLRDRVASPLGLQALSGPPGDVAAAVSCRLGNGRERDLARQEGIEIRRRRAPAIGSVQDGNARFLGGVCGHAGLFGSARSVWRLTAEWCSPKNVLEPHAVRGALGGRGPYALGWRRRHPAAANRSGVWYGHTGFTGGGAWFCPESGEVRVLLAHRSAIRVSLNDWQARFLGLSL